jgi:hypothetical protein
MIREERHSREKLSRSPAMKKKRRLWLIEVTVKKSD